MAFRLQTSRPGADGPDEREPKETLDLYGCDPDKPSFARACLLARRMIERGVRFVNIYHEGWDAHSDVAGNLKNNCGATDQASAALVTDLKQRGLLDDTLVDLGRRVRPHADGRDEPGARPHTDPSGKLAAQLAVCVPHLAQSGAPPSSFTTIKQSWTASTTLRPA